LAVVLRRSEPCIGRATEEHETEKEKPWLRFHNLSCSIHVSGFGGDEVPAMAAKPAAKQQRADHGIVSLLYMNVSLNGHWKLPRQSWVGAGTAAL
jgi:hypothetical protein